MQTATNIKVSFTSGISASGTPASSTSTSGNLKKFSQEKEIVIQLTDVSFLDRVVMLFNRVGRSLDSFDLKVLVVVAFALGGLIGYILHHITKKRRHQLEIDYTRFLRESEKHRQDILREHKEEQDRVMKDNAAENKAIKDKATENKASEKKPAEKK
jgi:hypothetical protein